MQSEDLFAPSAEGRVFVRRWPVEGSGRAPIVLLHDSLGSVAQWRDFPSKLAQATSREVIAYDRLGFGQSDPRDERRDRILGNDVPRGGGLRGGHADIVTDEPSTGCPTCHSSRTCASSRPDGVACQALA